MRQYSCSRSIWLSAIAVLLAGCGTEESSPPEERASLTLTTTGPTKEFVGRKMRFTNTVTNVGAAGAADVALTEVVQEGCELVSAASGGEFADGTLRWTLGSLLPGESRAVEVMLRATREGEVTRSIEARSGESTAVTTSSTTQVGGIPAILLEVVDLEDPVEVGQAMTYVVTVTNQGSGSDTGVIVECTLPPNTSLVSSLGATAAMGPGSISGRTITFPALDRLLPGAEVAYRITVRAETPADTRIRVTMRSDSLQGEGVSETEATNFCE